MSIRPLDIRDLPNIYRFRADAIGLDSARTLTRGNPLGAAGFLAYFNPARHVYSAVADGNEIALMGGIIHTRSESFARLHYIAPSSHLNHPELPALVENLSAQAGEWGAFHVLAEVDETSDAFPSMRQAGFSVYAWQRMWDVSNLTGPASGAGWMRVKSVHLSSVQSLYHQIVPPLFHPVEPAPGNPTGWMCNEGVKCYISVTQGMHGIVLTPLIHPEAMDVGLKLACLVNNLQNRRNRPVYLCVRSYQTWLEPVLEDLGALAAQRQAVMVKHLARLLKAEQAVRAKQPVGITVQPSRIDHLKNKTEKL
ncbi:MAG: hypothetical protein MUO77_20145 [Anaerolineales bacterium]|nr:hypothetical protein [Anaerolineales bacterium]